MTMRLKRSEYVFESVPRRQRRGFYYIFVSALGFTFFSTGLRLGSNLVVHMELSEVIIVALIGNGILGLYGGGLSYIAGKMGLSIHLLLRYSFGKVGAQFVSFLLSVTETFWYGIGMYFFMLTIEYLFHIPIGFIWIAIGTIVTITTYYGMRGILYISLISVPIITFFSLSIGNVVMNEIRSSNLFHLGQWKAGAPLSEVVDVIVTYFIAGATITPDIARFARTKKVGFFAIFFAFLLGSSMMMIMGAMYHLGVLAIGWETAYAIFLVPFFVVLFLNVWTSIDCALYSSSLGFATIVPIKQPLIVIGNGIVGIVLALVINDHFFDVVTLLITLISPIGSIVLTDYFLVHCGKYEPIDKVKMVSYRWTAFLSWIGSILIGSLLGEIRTLNIIVVACLLYLCLEYINKKRRLFS